MAKAAAAAAGISERDEEGRDMTGRIHGLLAGAAFALYAAAGAAAFAEPAPGPGGPPGGPGPGKAVMARAHPSPAERAARLRDLLQLKPAQEPALQTYVAALDSAGQGLWKGLGGMMSGGMPQTTPERLARMQQMMAQHQTAVAAMIDATRRFYDQLDPAQKRAFDALPEMMMHGGMMGGMGMMGGPGMMQGMGPPPPPGE
jgi:hypothetical protein